MIRKTMEEVTRIYCDVCNADITRSNQHVGMHNEVEYVVCTTAKYRTKGDSPKLLYCDDIAKFMLDNPNLGRNLRKVAGIIG